MEDDLHQFYGIDLSAPGLMHSRSWRWLSTRILGLLSLDRGPTGLGGSRLQRALLPTQHPSTLPVYLTKAPARD